MTDLKGKTAIVLGAGKSGISTARFLLTRGLKKIILSDTKPSAKFDDEAFALEKQGVTLETDGNKDSSIMEADLIIVSPGVPVLPKWRETADRHNKTLVGDVEFAYQFFKDSKVIAITGTNGKTT
ncbi:MAG: UDP-N-acetylmuramoyl-L-alanine--D-glutamate ligase, partial [Spirochaetia bacterium]|nr:UDP-N-acetylmuramoyl-L-alanine--D-glutamate ligase [Spirochaetia bacterium]